jgi:oxygen-independent coproporphyrinogen-3 oxidase
VISLPAELVARHGPPGPRYTSYPAAMHWGAPPAAAEWMAAMKHSLSRENARAGIYVHTPFCASLCTFCGCNMRVARSHALAAPYVETVLKEYALYRAGLDKHPLALGGLYLGGGSPTWLPPDVLERLLTGLLVDVRVTSDADFAIEADPRNTTREQLALLRRHGFHRIELGVQDFDARILEIVNRVQTEAEVRTAVEQARALGFTSIGFDMIHGLPLQTVESLRHGFDILLQLRPDHVSFYPYAHVPWIRPSQRLYTEADLPDTALRRELYLLGREMLGAAGYVEIGMDVYALPTDPLAQALAAGSLSRSFMGFAATPVDALLALGVSAMGDAGTAYAQNEKNLQRYEARVAAGEMPLQRGHVLSAADMRIRAHIWNLLAGRPAVPTADELSSRWWLESRDRVETLVADGLLEMDDSTLTVTARGRAFLPVIAATLDHHARHDALAASSRPRAAAGA